MIPVERFAVPLLVLAMLTGFGPLRAQEPTVPSSAVVNGDFAQPLDSGWTRTSRDLVGYHAFAPIKDGGMKVRKVQCGFARLTQDIPLATADVVLEVPVRLRASANVPGYHAYAALVVEYVDSQGTTLGETRYVTFSGRKPPAGTDVRHVVEVAPDGWQPVELDVAAELSDNLPGIPAADVAGLRIVFDAFGSGTTAC